MSRARGIRMDQAVEYGLKHMFFYVILYLVGFGLVFGGLAAMIGSEDGSAWVGFFLAILGIVIVFGGLHGAMYKIAGDATAKVINQSTVQSTKISSGTDTGQNPLTGPSNSEGEPVTDGEVERAREVKEVLEDFHRDKVSEDHLRGLLTSELDLDSSEAEDAISNALQQGLIIQRPENPNMIELA